MAFASAASPTPSPTPGPTPDFVARAARPAAAIPVSLGELLALALYDRVAVTIGVVVPLGLAVAAYLLSATQYDSTARLLMLPSSDYAAVSPLGNDPSVTGLDTAQIVSTEVELITNRSLLLALIDRLGMPAIYPDLGAGDIDLAVLRLQRDLVAEPVFAASVVRLRFRHRDPQRSVAVLEALLKLYLEQRARVLREDASGPVAQQENGLEARLREADAALYRFGVEHGIADLAEQRSRLLRLQSDLQDDLREQGAIAAAREAELVSLRAQRLTTPPVVAVAVSSGQIHDVENAKSALLTLQLRRRDLVNRLPAGDPLIADNDRLIGTVTRFIAAEPPRPQDTQRDGRNPLLGDIDRRIAEGAAELAGAQARVATASAQLAGLGGQLGTLAGLAPDYERLVGLQKATAESFTAFVPRAEEVRIADLVARARPSSVRLIDSPSPPAPVLGGWRLFALLGLTGSVVAGLAATFLRSSLRQTYVLPVEAQRDLGWPLLLTVNQVEPFAAAGRAGG